MSDHSLPEDYSRWPDDPFELLGAQRGTPPKDLKRSYARLIKIYKPEHHPEQFRRIREAYESALKFSEFFSRFDFSPPSTHTPPEPPKRDPIPLSPSREMAPSPPEAPADRSLGDESAPPDTFPIETSAGQPAGDETASLEPPSAERIPFPLEPPAGANSFAPRTPAEEEPVARLDEVHELWERAIRGEEAEAYRGLLRLRLARPQQATIVLRLYWLSTLDRSLDPERAPRDWLAIGLKTCGGHPSLLELYRREIESDPDEAFTPRFDELLGDERFRRSLPDLYSWRFAAVRKLRRWAALASDLPLARERLRDHDQAAWLRLLLLACDAAAWIGKSDPQAGLWDKLNREIHEIGHLATHHRELFDRLDYLAAVRDDWLKIGRRVAPPAGLLELIANSWHAPFHEYRAALYKVLDKIDDDPKRWLDHFNNLLTAAPALLGAFGEAMQELERRLDDQLFRPSPDIIAQLTQQFLGARPWPLHNPLNYALEFCCRAGIDPAWIAEAHFQQGVASASPLVQKALMDLANNWPLRYVCQARRFFWS